MVYLVQNTGPVTEEIRAKTGAEILNAVNEDNGALVVNGVSYTVQGDPAILVVSDTGDITESSYHFYFPLLWRYLDLTKINISFTFL